MLIFSLSDLPMRISADTPVRPTISILFPSTAQTSFKYPIMLRSVSPSREASSSKSAMASSGDLTQKKVKAKCTLSRHQNIQCSFEQRVFEKPTFSGMSSDSWKPRAAKILYFRAKPSRLWIFDGLQTSRCCKFHRNFWTYLTDTPIRGIMFGLTERQVEAATSYNYRRLLNKAGKLRTYKIHDYIFV